VAIGIIPSISSTSPERPGGFTVAVTVTLSPQNTFAGASSVVTVRIGFTSSVTFGDSLFS
jgi:hypothetical protein